MYYGYEAEIDGIKAIVFMPLENSDTIMRGLYNPRGEYLHLQSRDKVQVIKLYEKIDEFGAKATQKGKQLLERRTIEEPVDFYLKGEAINEWIEMSVVNHEYCTYKISEYASSYKEQETVDSGSSSGEDPSELAVPVDELADNG